MCWWGCRFGTPWYSYRAQKSSHQKCWKDKAGSSTHHPQTEERLGPRSLLMNRYSCCDGDELESESSGLFAETVVVSLGLFLVFDEEDTLIVRLSGGEQVIDDASQLVGGGGDSLRGAYAGRHGAVKVAQTCTVARHRLGGDAQGAA